MTLKLALVVVASLLVAACAPTPAAQPPAEPRDAARPPSCEAACEHLREIQCSLGKPTPRGASCEAVCANVQENNAGAGFPVACLTGAKTCAAADACR